MAAITNGIKTLQQFQEKEESFKTAAKQQREQRKLLQKELIKNCGDNDNFLVSKYCINTIAKYFSRIAKFV